MLYRRPEYDYETIRTSLRESEQWHYPFCQWIPSYKVLAGGRVAATEGKFMEFLVPYMGSFYIKDDLAPGGVYQVVKTSVHLKSREANILDEI